MLKMIIRSHKFAFSPLKTRFGGEIGPYFLNA